MLEHQWCCDTRRQDSRESNFCFGRGHDNLQSGGGWKDCVCCARRCDRSGGQSHGGGLNSLRGQQRSQTCRGCSEAARGQDSPQTVECARHALLCCFGRQAEPFANLLCRPPLEITPKDHVAFVGAQLGQRLVQAGREMLPESFRIVGVEMVHGGCLLFASSSAFLASDGVDRKVACCLMEPTRERETLLQLYRMLRQSEEHTLRHILGQVRVP